LPKIDAKSIRVEFLWVNKLSDEFKILADKITAWNEYLERHKTLLSIESGELVTDDASKAEIAKAAIHLMKSKNTMNWLPMRGKMCGEFYLFKKLINS
jgi:hypothetical protein